MAEDYLHITAREELAKAVVAVSNSVLTERKNNTSDPVYKTYVDVCRALTKELKS